MERAETVASESPPFWWEEADWRAWSLWSLSAIYGTVASHRMRHARRQPVDLPVLCVGNLTVGGSGKTPVAIALAASARKMGLKPGFLSRGHGGSFSRPHIVDAEHDLARTVGDEPLLLALHAPVAVTPDRAAGAALLAGQGCDFLIMDDGFQSARIAIDYALIVLDARYGVGNGHVIPAGPLRAPLVDQLRYADAVMTVGEGDAASDVVRKTSRAGRPFFEARLVARDTATIRGKRFLAFAGIGHPEKFFDTVTAAGATVSLSRSFPDHHVYAEDELEELVSTARLAEIGLITTSKDAARLRGATLPKGFAEILSVLKVEAVFELEQAGARIIGDTLEAWRRRRGVA